jgi:hypothetical protein
VLLLLLGALFERGTSGPEFIAAPVLAFKRA